LFNQSKVMKNQFLPDQLAETAREWIEALGYATLISDTPAARRRDGGFPGCDRLDLCKGASGRRFAV